MYTDTNILQFEKIPLFTGRMTDDSSDPPNTSIFASPISIFVSPRTTELRLDNAARLTLHRQHRWVEHLAIARIT